MVTPLTKLVNLIDNNPAVDSIRFQRTGDGFVMIVPYRTKPVKGYGAITITEKDFATFRKLYATRFSFKETASYEVVVVKKEKL